VEGDFVKVLLKIALSLLGLAIAGIVVVFIFLDTIVGKGIEAGCTKALGVETSVGLVRVGLLTGNFSIRGLRIANPPGFETDHFFSLNRLHFEVPPKSLREETIVVRLLELDGVGVTLETVDKKANYEVILDNLNRFSKTGSADSNAKESAGEDEEGGKGLVIHEVVIREIDARVDLGKVKGASDRVAVEIPEIRLRPNSETGSAEFSVAEVTQIVVTSVLVGIAKKAPAALAKNLLAGTGGLGNITMEIPGALSTGISSVGGATVKLGEGVGSGAKKLGEGAVDAVKGIGGLFRGGDEEK
jgi:hypothetical protein